MTFDLTIEFRTRLARAWIQAMRVARFVVGDALAERWAIRGSYRLSCYRIGRGTRFDSGWKSCAELRR